MTTEGRKVQRVSDNMDYVLPDLIRAAYESDHATFERLIADGSDINVVDERDNLTSLHIGCMQGDAVLIDIILAWDRATGSVDFETKSAYRPRAAWQFAMNGHHYELASKVDDAGLAKARRFSPEPD